MRVRCTTDIKRLCQSRGLPLRRMSSLTHKRHDFSIGWICALGHEFAASQAMLDERYGSFEEQDKHDDNIYVCGRIKHHEVVMACLPAGRYGKASAAGAAMNLLRSFPSVRFGVMVGIGGAVPDRTDIRLGDIVVSKPTDNHGGVIQYDMGKVLPGSYFKIKGHLNKPPLLLLNAIQSLIATHELRESQVHEYMSEMFTRFPKMRTDYGHPGNENDRLYKISSEGRGEFIHELPTPLSIARKPRIDSHGKLDTRPRIFYGLIGSGDRVITDAIERNMLQESANILCFEMEAAGLMDHFPCIVIRGISDYADAHKRDNWQKYAAAVAAAYAKELLSNVPTTHHANSTAKDYVSCKPSIPHI